LLERLRDGANALAWRDFFDCYWRTIYTFSKRCGGSDQTAEDVVQDVMLTLYEKRQVFRYDPSLGRFRNWLFTVVKNKVALRRRQQGPEKRPTGGEESDKVLTLPGGEEMPDAACEALFERALLLALLEVVRREVSPQTYQAFELTALHKLPAAEAAEITGITRNAVYLAHKRVLERLRELGASYRDGGQLDDRVKEALELYPSPAAERSLTARIETSLGARRGILHG
jgi:RNA polymerase sigma-70 factor (ECF subfamily)